MEDNSKRAEGNNDANQFLWTLKVESKIKIMEEMVE